MTWIRREMTLCSPARTFEPIQCSKYDLELNVRVRAIILGKEPMASRAESNRASSKLGWPVECA